MNSRYLHRAPVPASPFAIITTSACISMKRSSLWVAQVLMLPNRQAHLAEVVKGWWSLEVKLQMLLIRSIPIIVMLCNMESHHRIKANFLSSIKTQFKILLWCWLLRQTSLAAKRMISLRTLWTPWAPHCISVPHLVVQEISWVECHLVRIFPPLCLLQQV